MNQVPPQFVRPGDTVDWHEPLIVLEPAVDSAALHRRHATVGQLLTTWQPTPFEETATDCFKQGDDFWIWQPGVGGMRFRADTPRCSAFPDTHVDPQWFEGLIRKSWLPAVYLVWGRQVLHASAAARESDGAVFAFAGPSGAGKSTIAYALSRRSGFRHVCDDTLAFSWSGEAVALHPLRNDARLRPASAEFFGRADLPPAPVAWPDMPLRLSSVYLLEPDSHAAEPVSIAPMRASESYVRLLEQAHAFTLEIQSHNQRLMRDYLALAAAIPTYRLTYRRSFEDLDGVLDAVVATHG